VAASTRWNVRSDRGLENLLCHSTGAGTAFSAIVLSPEAGSSWSIYNYRTDLKFLVRQGFALSLERVLRNSCRQTTILQVKAH
jgi:hypothetical protein